MSRMWILRLIAPLKAGADVEMPVADMFWGDRYGKLVDPFGHKWSIATHTRDMSMEEIEEAQEEFMRQIAEERLKSVDRVKPAFRRGARAGLAAPLAFSPSYFLPCSTSVIPVKSLLHKYYSGFPGALIG